MSAFHDIASVFAALAFLAALVGLIAGLLTQVRR